MSALRDLCDCGHRRGLHTVEPPHLCTQRQANGNLCRCTAFEKRAEDE